MNRLFQAGYRFDFFQAAYLLERFYRDAARPGEDGPLEQEAIRFRSNQKRNFPATDVRRIERKSGGRTRMITENPDVAQMVLNFMGLYGVSSPLPDYFSEMIATLDDEEDDEEEIYDEAENGIRALRNFLDIFNHRIYSLYYRSWKKYRYHLQFEAGGEDDFSQYMLSLLGLDTPAVQDLIGVDVSRLISYAGVLGQRRRSAAGLQALLSGYFDGIDTKIIEFMPRWVTIPDEYRACLGAEGGGVPLRLGETFTIGDRIRDFSGKFRVVLAPLKLEAFQRFLPGGIDSQKLRQLVKLYAPDQLSFDVELLLSKDEVPPLQLGTGLAQLGWTSWLGKPKEDVVSIVFSYPQAEAKI